MGIRIDSEDTASLEIIDMHHAALQIIFFSGTDPRGRADRIRTAFQGCTITFRQAAGIIQPRLSKAPDKFQAIYMNRSIPAIQSQRTLSLPFARLGPHSRTPEGQ